MVLIPPLPGGGTASWWLLSRQALFPSSDHSASSVHHRLLYLERVPFLVLLSGFLSVFACFYVDVKTKSLWLTLWRRKDKRSQDRGLRETLGINFQRNILGQLLCGGNSQFKGQSERGLGVWDLEGGFSGSLQMRTLSCRKGACTHACAHTHTHTHTHAVLSQHPKSEGASLCCVPSRPSSPSAAAPEI